MGLLLKNIFNLLRLLHSESGHHQISWAVAAGFIMGMSPALSIQTILVFFFILFFRVQMAMAFASAFMFAFIAYLFDPLFHRVGFTLLSHPDYQALWENLYNMPLVPFTRFNNTVVLGSGVFAIFLAPFVYLITLILVKKYRDIIVTKFKGTSIYRAFQASKFYQWYQKYNFLYGA